MSSCRKHAAVLIILSAAVVSPSYARDLKPLRIIGQVVDYQARPVEGAQILLYHEATDRPIDRKVLTELGKTRSLPDVRFSLTTENREGMFPGIRWLIAYKEGLAMSWTTEGLGVRSIVLVLGEPKPLGGVVVDEAGRPVSGAKVSLCLKNEMMELRELPLPGSEDWQTRPTNNQGRFLFGNVPANTTTDFRIEAPGRAPVWTFCGFGLAPGEQFPAGRTDVRIVLQREARVEGRVVDEATGQAVSDVRVLARPQEQTVSDYCPAPAFVDPNGRFTLAGLTSGRYQLQAIAREGQVQEWFGESTMLTAQAGQTVNDVILAVNRGAALEVLIREPDSDMVVEAAQVTVSSDTFTAAATTDANGRARLHVPAGKHNIQAFKPEHGFTYPPREVQLESGQTQREELRLAVKPMDLAGTVMDPQGHALPDASVFHWPFWLTPPTNAEGQFEQRYYTTASRTKQMVLARHEPSGLARIAELTATGTRRIEGRITLQPAYSLIGRVVDANEAGIPAAYVRLIVCSPGRTGMATEVIADRSGVYRIRAVPTPPANDDTPHFAVVAHAPGYNEASVDPVPLDGPAEEPIHLKNIVLQRANRMVSGIVVDANDRPLPGVVVETPHFGEPSGREDAVQPHRRVLSDDYGRFRLQGICQGPVEITARSSQPGDPQGTTHTYGGETDVKVVLGRTLTFAKSWAGTRSPDWDQLGLSPLASQLVGKAVLLCFVDIQQRPSRHLLTQLNQESLELANKDIVMVGVQIADGAPADLAEWMANESNALPVVRPGGNAENLRRTWGIQSLPWLILMDRDRNILAAGTPAQIPSLQTLLSP